MKIKFLLIQLFLLCTSLCMQAQDQTILIATSNNYGTQKWFYSGHGNSLETQKVKNYYNEGYYITSLSYTGKGWFVAMNKNCGLTSQTYKYTSDWPKEWLKEKQAAGYYITSIASGNKMWMIVVSKGTGYTGQVWKWETWDNLKGFLHKYWDLGYSITNIEYHNQKWLLVMSANAPYKEQSCIFKSSISDVISKVNEYWDNGKRIQLIEYGDNKYFILASKNKSGALPSQSLVLDTKDVKAWISEQWSHDRDVTYIGGGVHVSNKVHDNAANHNHNHNNNNNNNNHSHNNNNNHNNHINNNSKKVVIDATLPYMNGTARHVIYSDGSGYSAYDFPCTNLHCRNGRCTMCNGTGIFVHPMVNYTTYCTICNNGLCKYCGGKGRITNSKHWAPGEAQAYMQAVQSLKNGGYDVPEEKIKKNTGVCPDCGGKGYRPKSYQYAAGSSLPPYHNSAGDVCPICGTITDHYHYRCTTCKRF